jgi:hypothetical protein
MMIMMIMMVTTRMMMMNMMNMVILMMTYLHDLQARCGGAPRGPAADSEGDRGDFVLARADQGPLRHRDLRHGRQHARAHRHLQRYVLSVDASHDGLFA